MGAPEPADDRGGVELIAAALVPLFGFELLRAFLPLCTFFLHTVRGLHPFATAAVAFGFLTAGALAPTLARRFGTARALLGAGTVLAAARLLLQLVDEPATRLWIAGLGAAAFSLALPLQRLAADSDPARLSLALGWATGLTADFALRVALGSLDLVWQPGRWPLLVVAPAAVVLILALVGLAGRRREPAREPSQLSALFALAGGWLFLEMALFQNPAALAALTGGRATTVAAWAGGGKALGLIGALLLLPGRRRRLHPSALALALLGAVLALQAGGPAAGPAAFAGSALSVLLLVEIVRSPARGVARRQAALAAAPAVLLLALLFLLYAGFDMPLRLPPAWLAPATLAAMALAAALRPAPPPRAGRLPVATRAAVCGMALTAALAPWARQAAEVRPPGRSRPSSDSVVRVATYNLHQGFDVRGRLDPEGLATAIERTGADVVALQEVVRGWVVTGSLDLLDWLAQRLGMEARFGPTADPYWGNAVLSRHPILAARNLPLPPDTLPLKRGVLDVSIAVGATPLRLLVTHLHHRRGDQPVRDRQTRRLLELWAGAPRTLLLGDLNSRPGTPAIDALRAGGLRKSSDLLPAGERSTHRLHGPVEIDYIWATPDLVLEAAEVVESTASDHLPVAVTVRLAGP